MNESEPCCTGAAETQGLFRSLAVPTCLRATECCLWWSHSPHSDRSWWLQGVTLPDLASPGPCGAHQVQGTRTELLGGAGSTLRAEEQASVKQEVAFSGVRRLARRTNGARVFFRSDPLQCSFRGCQTGCQGSLGVAACISFVEKVVGSFLKRESTVHDRWA